MHTKKAILVRKVLRQGSFFRYEKEGQDIHIVRISTNFECQQVNFLIFPDIIT